ncbi:MAG: dockerin type I repeat-containing protein [Firmicutes bacterium]|nr:dockerin type I repeat-containing protein [Bacillota bacterium]
MQKKSKLFIAAVMAMLACMLMTSAVYASTQIKTVYIDGDVDIGMTPKSGDEIIPANFRIKSTDPAEAMDVVYIDEDAELGWYRNGNPCKKGEKFAVGNTYTLRLKVAIKPAYVDQYWFYKNTGYSEASFLRYSDGTYMDSPYDEKTYVFNKSYRVEASETDPPVITTSDETFKNVIGDTFSFSLSAAGYQPITWSVEGLPEGLSMKDNVISGTLEESGQFTFTVRAENANGSDSKSFVLNVDDDGNYIKSVYLEGEIKDPVYGDEIINPELKIVGIFPPEAANDMVMYGCDWGVCNKESIPPIADTYNDVTTKYFEGKKYILDMNILCTNPSYWNLTRAKIYINGVSVVDYGKTHGRTGSVTRGRNPQDAYDTMLYGRIYYNKLVEKPKFCEQPESIVASQTRTEYEVSWRTSFKPVKVEIWQDGAVKETITDMGFTDKQLLQKDYTMTHTLTRAYKAYMIRAYYGTGEYDYEDCDEFTISFHKPVLLSQPHDAMIPSGESGVILSYKVNFMPVRVDYYKNGDLVMQKTDFKASDFADPEFPESFTNFTEGMWRLTIYESEKYLSRPAQYVETGEFYVSKYAKPVITAQPTAEEVPYIGGGTSVKIQADNAYAYKWFITDKNGVPKTWSYASEQGWCDMVDMSDTADTLVLENVSEDITDKFVYCQVYDHSGNYFERSEMIQIGVAKKINIVEMELPGLENICGGDNVSDYGGVSTKTKHCSIMGGFVTDDGETTFAANKPYVYFAVVTAEDGYGFSDSPTGYLNGGEIPLTNKQDTYVAFMKTITIPEAAYLKGDIDGSGRVDNTDAKLLLGNISNTAPLTEDALDKADVKADGNIDMLDVIWILNHKTA